MGGPGRRKRCPEWGGLDWERRGRPCERRTSGKQAAGPSLGLRPQTAHHLQTQFRVQSPESLQSLHNVPPHPLHAWNSSINNEAELASSRAQLWTGDSFSAHLSHAQGRGSTFRPWQAGYDGNSCQRGGSATFSPVGATHKSAVSKRFSVTSAERIKAGVSENADIWVLVRCRPLKPGWPE